MVKFEGEFPWTVAIFKKENQQDGQCLNIFICGGSIIEPGIEFCKM